MSNAENLTLVTADGYPISATRYPAQGAARASVQREGG